MHATTAQEGMGVQRHSFFTSAVDGGEWSASRSGRSTRGERVHGTHRTGGKTGLRAGLGALDKRM
jgi:hypothetical protein